MGIEFRHCHMSFFNAGIQILITIGRGFFWGQSVPKWPKRFQVVEWLCLISHMLHVWYIYLQNWVIIRANVGKNPIHGAYGYNNYSPTSTSRNSLKGNLPHNTTLGNNHCFHLRFQAKTDHHTHGTRYPPVNCQITMEIHHAING